MPRDFSFFVKVYSSAGVQVSLSGACRKASLSRPSRKTCPSSRLVPRSLRVQARVEINLPKSTEVAKKQIEQGTRLGQDQAGGIKYVIKTKQDSNYHMVLFPFAGVGDAERTTLTRS